MKYLSLICSIITLLSCIACNKDHILTSRNSLSAISRLEEDKKQELISLLSKYNVNCRLRTGTFILDSTGLNPIAVLIDSLFIDTMTLSLTENMVSDDNTNQSIDKNTIFVSTEHKKHKHTSLFYVYLRADTIRFGYPLDGYSCKCSGGLRFENDSIFYRNYSLNSFHNKIECSGTKVN